MLCSITFLFLKKKCTRLDIVTISFHIKGNNLKVWICIGTVSRGILLINKLKCKGFLHIYVYLCSATKRSNKLLTAYKFTLSGDVVVVCCTPYNIWILFPLEVRFSRCFWSISRISGWEFVGQVFSSCF